MKNSEQIRIVYVINHPDLSGSNKALLNILDGLKEFDICPLIIIGIRGSICIELEKRSIKYEIIKHYFSIYPSLNSIKSLISFMPRLSYIFWINNRAKNHLTRLVKQFNPDLIHTNIGPDQIGFQVAKKLNIPHVWHVREYQDLDFNMHPFPSKKRFIKKLQMNGNHSIAITNGIHNYFSMLNNSRVIYDGVIQKSRTQFKANKEKYFLFVGRLTEAKGIEVLLKAYIKFFKTNEDFELLVAGDGNTAYLEKLFQMINDSKLSPRIRFLGFRTDIDNLMANATALIVASRCEGFGFITAEAMFNGCLVIGNNSGGTKEILENEKLGILYSGEDELVSSMHKVAYKGIESYFPIIIKAQEYAARLYSREQNVEAIYNYYSEILGINIL